jgi:hypothetical protein
MNIFFDSEFTGLIKDTTLISLCFISENGDSFYAEFTDYDKSQVDEWIQANIIYKLLYNSKRHFSEKDYDTKFKKWVFKDEKNVVLKHLKEWFNLIGHEDVRYKFWGDFPVYDWILITDLFGGHKFLPSNFCIRPFDISVLFEISGLYYATNRYKFAELDASNMHNCSYDTLAIKKCYEKLMINN